MCTKLVRKKKEIEAELLHFKRELFQEGGKNTHDAQYYKGWTAALKWTLSKPYKTDAQTMGGMAVIAMGVATVLMVLMVLLRFF